MAALYVSLTRGVRVPMLRLLLLLGLLHLGLQHARHQMLFGVVGSLLFAGPLSAVLGKPVLDALHIDPSNPFHLAYTASKASGQPAAFSAYADLVKRWV